MLPWRYENGISKCFLNVQNDILKKYFLGYVNLRENMNGNVPFYHFSNIMGTFLNILKQVVSSNIYLIFRQIS